ncbi:hypothetical protein C0J52_24876 [Blattella germanica]|nr:hypothetical protein C0J52_24876 [Blattella germanica]
MEMETQHADHRFLFRSLDVIYQKNVKETNIDIGYNKRERETKSQQLSPCQQAVKLKPLCMAQWTLTIFNLLLFLLLSHCEAGTMERRHTMKMEDMS